MLKRVIERITAGEGLDHEAAHQLMTGIMNGQFTDVQTASVLTALKVRGETVTEITAFAEAMRERTRSIQPDFEVLDLVGTGGDGGRTFNISTTSAFVVASGGVPVAKHGNRAISSRSGAADLLEKLGADLTLSPAESLDVLRATGICFLFAPFYHPMDPVVGQVRTQLGFRTVFNILGPLTNPAGATRELMGVYCPDLIEPLAKVLANLGVRRGMVLCGRDGLDEASLSASTDVCEFQNGHFESRCLVPEEYGLALCRGEELTGGTPAENAVITRDILAGREIGPRRDIVLFNAGIAFYLAGKTSSILDGVRLARDLLAAGEARSCLERFLQLCRHLHASRSRT